MFSSSIILTALNYFVFIPLLSDIQGLNMTWRPASTIH